MPRANRVTRLAPKPARIQPTAGAPLRLRLACKWQPREDGFLGIDGEKTDAIDYVVDLKKIPWPIDDGVVDTIFTAHYFQRLEMPERIAFMNECFRVLKVGAQLIIVTPNEASMRATADPRAKWPPISALSFYYFNKEWREKEHYDDIGIECDYDFGYGYALEPDMQVRNQEYQQHAIKYWNNAALDLHVTLTKRG